MARFFNDHDNAAKEREDVLTDFSDLLFAELQQWGGEDAPEKLAKHLNIEIEDVYAWLKGESLPCRRLFCRLMKIIRGDAYFECRQDGSVKNSTWAKAVELVHEAENVHALAGLKLTKAKT